MGNFYVNYTVRGPSQRAVADALAGRSAIITPAKNSCVVVFDQQSDDQDMEVIAGLASDLSGELRCPVLAILNHDDDILWYQLHDKGELVDEYDSSPGYFDSDAEPTGPSGGDARKLCTAFASANVADVESILRKSSLDEDGYAFAIERHSGLVSALGMPPFAVGGGYGYISDGELPEGLAESDLIKVE